jgi:uncharacterized membrane protein YhaH (DUF805 family)
MLNYYLACWQKFGDFNGRSRRSEYWYFVLMNIIVQYGIGYVLGLISPAIGAGFALIYSLATLIPSIACGIRRMHDTGKSGWFLLIPFYNLILACTEGDSGPNEYGTDPKGGGGSSIVDDTILDSNM